MLKSVTRPCPICASATGEILHTQRFILPEGHPQASGYDVVCCPCCGFVYADTITSQRDYEEYYAKLSKYANNETSTASGTLHCCAERLQQTAADIASIVPDKHARIVDIGCADGGLLRILSNRGYTNLCGIDPALSCVTQAAQVPGVDAYMGSLSQILWEAGPFDCLILSHVLEHVRDLRLALTYLQQFLKPNARLYVETPDATRYAAWAFSPFQDFNTEHINHFSLVSMTNLLCQCGFTPTSSGTKVFQLAPNKPFPALFVVAAKAADLAVPSLKKDEELRFYLEDYIAISRRMMGEIDERLQCVLEETPEVLVWGTGQLTMKLLAETALANAEIVAFVDSNPINQGLFLQGVPILAPSQVEPSMTPIIVASTLHYRDICESIRQCGLPNPVIALRSMRY